MLSKKRFSLLLAVAVGLAMAFSIDANAAGLGIAALSSHASTFGDFSMLGMGTVAAVSQLGGNHASQSKFFRVAVEGQTTDGRTISREWISQMAKNYSATLFGARVNMEHYRGIFPDGPFKAYGDVLALEARDLTGEFAGKLGLYAQISPTPDLVSMLKARQKIYTSIEVDPSFSDTKQAYMVGLAVTDSPASLGTEILSFSAQNPTASPFAHKKQKPDNLFSSAVEEVAIEFEEGSTVSIFTRVKELLGMVKTKADTDDSRFGDLTQAVETLASHGKEQSDFAASQSKVVAQLLGEIGDLKAGTEKDRAAFAELKTMLSTSGNGQATRPAATGATGAVTTDC